METMRNSRRVTPRVKTLAAALSIALAGGLAGAFGAADAASHPPTHQGAANKSAWVSHAKYRAPQFDKLLAQFAAFSHSARPAPSRAPTTRVISSRNDSGSGSLRGALADAVDGDIIDLRNVHGTINLSDVLQTTANVEIRGPGRDQLTIDGGGKNRVFSASHGLRLSNVTIANGSAPRAAVTNGGCLYAAGELYLNNVTLSGCTAGDATSPIAVGGAVSVQGGLYLYNSTINNSTATGYTYAAGGGAFVIGGDQSGSYTAVYNSTVSGNSATVVEGPKSYLATGGGLQVVGSTGTTPYASYAQITKSIITGNHATVQATYNNNSYELIAQGGGAYFRGVDSQITGSTVEYNTMYSYYFALGAGVASSGTLTISNSKVLKNSGTAGFLTYGGGVFAFAPVTIDRTSIQNNTVDSFISVGGGVSSLATTSLTNSVVSGNAAGITTAAYSTGGGVGRKYSNHVGHASTTITNSTISGNTAAPAIADGGGVFEAEALTLNNSTVAFNTSTNGGGVTTASDATIALFSTIIANNTAAGGPSSADLYAYGGPITATGDHNLIIASDSGVTLPGDTLKDDPLLKPLAMNGGPTMTHALDPTSPAVDAGSNPLTLIYDQRGSPYARVVGPSADIGAYELDTDHIFGNGFE